MANLRLTAFSGEVPKLVPRLLPEMAAQNATNVRLDNGAISPVRKSAIETVLGSTAGAIYLDGSTWYSWASSLVRAVPAPIDDTRFYVTGDGAPKMVASGTSYGLAFAAPATALTGTVGGTATASDEITRLYTYTNVTQFGEESEPAPLTAEIVLKTGETVTLSGFSVTTSASRTIDTQRIYRSQTTLNGTQLFFIHERAASTSNFVDNISIEDIVEPIQTIGFTTPPSDLAGLIALPNGMMAAFRDKQLYFCEPYQPHAWPEGYIQTTDYKIVGLGAFGNSIVVVTEGNPYIFTGTHPSTMQSEKMELNLPCLGANTLVDMGYGVAYASHEGLVMVSPSGTNVVSKQLFTRTDWQLLNPASFVSGQYRGQYFASYAYVDDNGEPREGTFIIDTTGEQATLLRANFKADAFYYHIPTGALYYLVDKTIYEYDAKGEAFELGIWKSKEFVLPTPTSFGAILIEADTGMTQVQIDALNAEIAAIIAANTAIFVAGDLGGSIGSIGLGDLTLAGDLMQPVPSLSLQMSVNIYADKVLVDNITTYNEAERITSGYLARVWEVEVTADFTIVQITLAGTMMELRGV